MKCTCIQCIYINTTLVSRNNVGTAQQGFRLRKWVVQKKSYIRFWNCLLRQVILLRTFRFVYICSNKEIWRFFWFFLLLLLLLRLCCCIVVVLIVLSFQLLLKRCCCFPVIVVVDVVVNSICCRSCLSVRFYCCPFTVFFVFVVAEVWLTYTVALSTWMSRKYKLARDH